MKNTKRALFSSVVALILCFSMLVGTTFAWFTDEVKSGVNQIVAGNLDVEVYYGDPANKDSIQDIETLFDDVTLWEPGAVAYENLTVVNEGTLALKYQLSVNFANENTVDGYGLSQVLQVAVVEDGFSGTREEAMALEGTALADFMLPGELKATESKTYGIVIWWEPSADDNNWNVNNGKTTSDGEKYLHIDLGVKLFATQLDADIEQDSFGPGYDEDAWHPEMQVATAADLQAALNNGETNITLIDDIETDEPIVIPAPVVAPAMRSVSNGVVIDLNGKTLTGNGVSPIRVDGAVLTIMDSDSEQTGKIVNNGGPTAIDLCRGATLNFVSGSIESNSDGIYAYGEGNTIFMTGGSVKASDVDNHPAICVWASDSLTVSGGTVSGALVIFAEEGASVSVSGGTFSGLFCGLPNSVTGGTFTDEYVSEYVADGYKAVDNGDGTFSVIFPQESFSDLINNAQPGVPVEIPAGEYDLPTLAGKEGITIIGAADGSTVIGGDDASTGFGGNFGKNTTIQNVTFSGNSNGVRYSYAQGGTSTFENCTFAGDSTYGFHIDQSDSATFIFNNCTFSGFNAFAGDLEKVVFNNCTFLHNGNYGHTNIWSVAEFNNCTFGDKASVGTRGDNAHLFFNGVEESYHHEYIGSAESLFAFADSVNNGGDSWKNQAVILVADIDLKNAVWTPIGQTGATEFKGIFDGNGYTIKNLNVDNSAATDEHTSSGLFGWAESNVTIKNVKIDGAKVIGNHNVAVIVGYTYSGKIINCHVTNAEIICNHANGDACGDKCGLIAGYAGDESRFTDCSASDSTVKAGRDGGQLIGAGYNVSVSNCTATNVVVSATGDCNREGNINNEIIGRVLG